MKNKSCLLSLKKKIEIIRYAKPNERTSNTHLHKYFPNNLKRDTEEINIEFQKNLIWKIFSNNLQRKKMLNMTEISKSSLIMACLIEAKGCVSNEEIIRSKALYSKI